MIGRASWRSPSRQPAVIRMQSKLSSEELAQELRDRYSYNPLTGQLIHRKRRKPISTQKARYQTTSIYVDGQLYRMNVHMAVWLW